MSARILLKSAVSVTEMASMLDLSRARFYQLLQAGTFPSPDHVAETGRPYYSEEKQRLCLEVRHQNRGVDGKPVLFYSPRRRSPIHASPSRKSTTQITKLLLNGLKALGLPLATAEQVDVALQKLYPQGVAGLDHGEVLRAIFLQIQNRDLDKVHGKGGG